MADEASRRADQARSADRVAEVFTPEPLLPPSRSSIREPLTVADEDEVSLFGSFAQLRRLSLRMQHDLTTGQPVSDEQWEELGEVFAIASKACLEQVIKPTSGEIEPGC